VAPYQVCECRFVVFLDEAGEQVAVASRRAELPTQMLHRSRQTAAGRHG
jgi:hypothetical protein